MGSAACRTGPLASKGSEVATTSALQEGGERWGGHLSSLHARIKKSNEWLSFSFCQRPIVEFSLEDRRKLKIKEMRMQRSLVQKGNFLGWGAF